MARTKRRNLMPFVWTFLAVIAGIYVWSKWQTAKATGGTISIGPLSIKPAPSPNAAIGGAFEGPDIDPITGAYKAPGAMTGTVNFSSQPVN